MASMSGETRAERRLLVQLQLFSSNYLVTTSRQLPVAAHQVGMPELP